MDEARDVGFPAIFFNSGALVVVDGVVRFNPKYSYIMFRGGRARGGSWTMIGVAVLMATQQRMRILVVRQNSSKIKTSVWVLISDTAERLGLLHLFTLTKTHIAVANGSTFTYDYMHNNSEGIKSKEGVDLTIGEECQQFEARSILSLKQTVMRKHSSQFIGCMNPLQADTPAETHIVNDPDTLTVNSTIYDNYFAPAKSLRDAEKLKNADIELYNHYYLGSYYVLSDVLVIGGKCIMEDFKTPDDAVFYHGADWSNGGAHPHAFTRSFITGNTLYIDWELKTVGALVDGLFEAVDTCQSLKRGSHLGWKIYCDGANPANTATFKRAGFEARNAQKNFSSPHGAKMAGVEYLRKFDKIVFHTRCPRGFEESQRWKWVEDAKTGEILPVFVDGWDDIMDSIRYAHYRNIRRGL